MAVSLMAWNMDLENGNLEINFTAEHGNSINLKDKATSNLLSHNTMEISEMDTNMAKEFNFSTMETDTMECILMENQKVKVLMLGAMVLFIRDSLRTDWDLAMESGNMDHKSMKELM